MENLATILEDEIAKNITDLEDGVDNIIIPMNMNNLFDEDGEALVEYDEKEFKKGIKKGSEVAGVITALMNTGISEASMLSVFEMLFTEQLFPQQAKLQKDLAQIEKSKMEMQQL